MQNSDEIILKKIQQLFGKCFQKGNFVGDFFSTYTDLSGLYAGLSFSRPYTTQELFPNFPADCKISDRAISKAEEHSREAQTKWTCGDFLEPDKSYFSCRQAFKEQTGIDVGREYTYPDNMSPQEFQESFNATVLSKRIAEAYVVMAQSALFKQYDAAFGYKIFLEREKPKSAILLENAYHKFWEANSEISGHEDLKNIQNFDEMRKFLMGVASEIPLDDVAAFVHDEDTTKNTARFKKEFHHTPVFFISDKTWEKHIQPVLEKRSGNYLPTPQAEK